MFDHLAWASLSSISLLLQTKAVPDNRRQAESLSLSREVCRSRVPQQSLLQAPVPFSPRGAAAAAASSLASASASASASAASAKLSKLQELQDKKETMDKILQELHSLRDQTLNNSSCERHFHHVCLDFKAFVLCCVLN